MTKVEAIENFEYQGAEIKKGFQIWVHGFDLDNLVKDRKVRVLIIPENRQYK